MNKTESLTCEVAELERQLDKINKEVVIMLRDLTVRAITISGYQFRALWLVEVKIKTKQTQPRDIGNE